MVVINAEGADLALPPEIFHMFKEKLIDTDLHKIAAPLEHERIEHAEITTNDGSGEVTEAIIGSETRIFPRGAPISI